ncbi:spore coat associated protein CotJA [Halobacillus sp. A1]|uniref:spore coat associated protein CotJA n=1 Tax=Halobacillus sp. A1 TaxID=2880262 RepID=UPI0020A63769|nr:spore coat associated protein CotJA [Halobacillus sp. A1]MCP3032695.1 spore coat associated protein CotJA [Halobacillus sp. A1]
MYTPIKWYQPYVSTSDPCPPMRWKYYQTPPNLYLGFQPTGLPQYSLKEALCKGTLWPVLFDLDCQHKTRQFH